MHAHDVVRSCPNQFMNISVCSSTEIQNGPSARRHIMVRDSHGCTGLTVWHADVHKFPKEILGGVITITRASESKCVLGTRAIAHLGFIVNSEGIHIDPRRVDRLLRMGISF